MGARPKSEDAKPKGKSHGEEKAAGELFASCSFTDLGLHPTLCQHLQDAMGFVSPTKVQAQAIPVVISGRHSLINAPTGTGKTIAYLAPIIHLLQMQVPPIQRSDGTFALVMVPTRELCMQVYQISQKLVHRFHWIVPGYIMGGENRSKEKSRLRKGISILVSTPGRLLDHLKNTSAFSYSKLRWIVFDEADRILELGFGKAIEEILDFLGSRKNLHSIEERKGPKARLAKRQILLLSATLNEKVNHLANISLDNPVMVGFDSKTPKLWMQNQETVSTISERNGEKKMSDQTIDAYNLPEQLDQKYVKVSCGSRLSVLLSVLKTLFGRQVHQKIVVFFSTCDAVDFHHSLLNGFCWSPDKEHKGTFVGCKAFRLHGNMDHDDRKLSFLGFKVEKSALLLCTDVAARGLDFSKVKFIIQYDSPGEATEYVHRVGRTARLGEKGEAILFLQPIELEYIHDLQKHGVILREFSLKKILDSFSIYDQRYPKSMTSLDMHPWLLSLQKELENFISSEFEIYNLAKEAFCSWVRAYAAHRGDLKNIFMVKKLHLGHVARSFGLREQPSLVGSSFQTQMKKRKKQQKMSRPAKRTKQGSATARVMV